MRVHQAFVRLTSVAESTNNKQRGHEIFFVAEPDAAHVYKFDMVILSSRVLIPFILSQKDLFRYNINFGNDIFSQWEQQPWILVIKVVIMT